MTKKTKIIHSTLKIIAEKGFENSTLEEISRDAGVGKGTLYLYFRDKDDLYLSSINYLMNQWGEEAGNIVKMNTDPVSKIEEYLNRTVNVILNNKTFAKIAFREIPNYMLKAKQCNIEMPIKMYSMRSSHLVEIIEQGKKENYFKNVDSEIAASIIIGAMNTFIMRYVIFSEEYNIEKYKTFKCFIIDMLKKEVQ